MWPFRKSFEVYTDGSAKDGRGSWAYVIVRKGLVLREESGFVRRASSNEMEFQAAIEALKSLPKNSKVHLYSDSKILVLSMCLWRTGWKANGWKKPDGHPAPRSEQLKSLDALDLERKVSWSWVRAHAGNPHNERCDELCVRARS
jgi:ribonuclease HI